MGYTYGSDFGAQEAAGLAGAGIWMLIALILSLVGCFLVYFLFVTKKEEPTQKFAAWLKELLSFNKMLVEPILKICYIFAALFTTLSSFAFIGQGGFGFLMFILTITLGNLGVRVIYEFILIKIMVWKNTTEINKKLK